jgi:hypothetical protein
MVGATFEGSIDCHTAKIGSDLYLASGQFKKEIDLTGANIGSELTVNGLQGASLTLRNTKIGRIPDVADAWPPVLEIDGLTYRSIVAAENSKTGFAERITTRRSLTRNSPPLFRARGT